MEITFLTLEEVLLIHTDQIDRYGGSSGIRDIHFLESAIAVVQAGFGGVQLHQDLFEMAGAYLFHIVKNHPFIDGASERDWQPLWSFWTSMAMT